MVIIVQEIVLRMKPKEAERLRRESEMWLTVEEVQGATRWPKHLKYRIKAKEGFRIYQHEMTNTRNYEHFRIEVEDGSTVVFFLEDDPAHEGAYLFAGIG